MTLALRFGVWFSGGDAEGTGDARVRTPRLCVVAEPSDEHQRATVSETQALLARIRANDEEAFRCIFDAHATMLVRVARVYTHSVALAQDVVQDVFVALWERRATISIRESMAAYLIAATRHRALNVLRAESRAAQRDTVAVRDALVQGTSTPHEGAARVDAEEFDAAFREAVELLPDRQREIFLLHREHGLDHRTIAGMLGIGVPSVHNLMSRAMKRLYERLKGFA